MEQPAGRPAPETPAKPPSGDPLHGRYTSLLPLEQSHSGPLFTHLGGERNSNLWKYIPEPGNPDRATFDDRIRMYITSDVFHPYAILTGPVSDPASEPAGIAAYLAIVPEHLRIEIGGIVGVKLQRTRAMTEVFYLLIKHAIEDLGYHRVEWKAHSENKLSLSAAERLGFLFEGVFRWVLNIQTSGRKLMGFIGTIWLSMGVLGTRLSLA